MKDRGCLTNNEYKEARPCGSHCARIYGLSKIHKTGVPFRSVMSAIGSYNYRLAKVLASKLEPLRKSEHMLRDTFHFIESIKKLSSNMTEHKMKEHQIVSLDVISLLTKVPLVHTIDIILDKFYEKSTNVFKANWCPKCRNRDDMKKLLDIATSDTHFSFDGKYYQQHNGVAMSSPMASVLADILMIQLENKLMKQLQSARVMLYKRYVDAM